MCPGEACGMDSTCHSCRMFLEVKADEAVRASWADQDLRSLSHTAVEVSQWCCVAWRILDPFRCAGYEPNRLEENSAKRA